MWRDKVLSLNWWKKWLAILALVGIVLVVAGRLLDVKAVNYVGMGLLAPLVLGGLLALLVGVPYVIWAGRQGRNHGNDGTK